MIYPSLRLPPSPYPFPIPLPFPYRHGEEEGGREKGNQGRKTKNLPFCRDLRTTLKERQRKERPIKAIREAISDRNDNVEPLSGLEARVALTERRRGGGALGCP